MAMMNNKNNFYVYLHKRKDDNSVFYIGKGRNSRAYQKRYRNKEWQSIVNSVGFYNEFAEKNMSEEEAFKLEKDLIKQYGINNLANINLGGDGGVSRDNNIVNELKENINDLIVLLDIGQNFDKYWKSSWFRKNMETLCYLEKLQIQFSNLHGT